VAGGGITATTAVPAVPPAMEIVYSDKNTWSTIRAKDADADAATAVEVELAAAVSS